VTIVSNVVATVMTATIVAHVATVQSVVVKTVHVANVVTLARWNCTALK